MAEVKAVVTDSVKESAGLLETLKSNIMDFFHNPEALLAIITKVVLAFLIYWIGKKIARFLSNMVAKGLNKADSDPISVNFLKDALINRKISGFNR